MNNPSEIVERLPIYPTCTCHDAKNGHSDHCPTLRHPFKSDGTPKIAPVQGYTAGIPWSVHLDAYDAYRAKWSSQAAMIDLEKRGCRGGFGVKELDGFIPGWRARVSEIAALKTEIETLQAERLEARRLIHASLFHLRLDDRARAYHAEAEAFLGANPEGGKQ